jgi:hypothetical protein
MKQRQEVEMVDGRVYFSDDNWATIWLRRRGKTRRVTGHEANLARFLAIHAH